MLLHTETIAEYLGINASTYFRKNILGQLVNKGFLVEDSTGQASVFLANSSKVFVK